LKSPTGNTQSAHSTRFTNFSRTFHERNKPKNFDFRALLLKFRYFAIRYTNLLPRDFFVLFSPIQISHHAIIVPHKRRAIEHLRDKGERSSGQDPTKNRPPCVGMTGPDGRTHTHTHTGVNLGECTCVPAVVGRFIFSLSSVCVW